MNEFRVCWGYYVSYECMHVMYILRMYVYLHVCLCMYVYRHILMLCVIISLFNYPSLSLRYYKIVCMWGQLSTHYKLSSYYRNRPC